MNTTEIWNSFKQELLGFIKSRVNDNEIAEDLLQEIFIKIHLNKSSITEESKLTSWIYQITRNTIIDHYRKKKIITTKEELAVQLPEEVQNSNADFTKCLNSFVNHLSASDQEAISKTAYGGLSQKEYAASINLSYSATKSRIQRARKKLKELFIECCAIESDNYGNIISNKKDDCNC